ncbi:MAG: hypothetical protein IRZ21_00340 [Thermoleophilaceae bacterium]|nr:hypothetical protein [Thermoleophilaceae bacterium]
MRRPALLLAAAAGAALGVPAAAPARDPGRWALVRVDKFPASYNQGVASRGSALYFDGAAGSFARVFRTDPSLRELAQSGDPIPPEVRAGEGYNHIGDLSWDRGDGGRLLLPLECYVPGGPNGGNTCGTGSIAALSPGTLTWSYYVKLDPRDIAKAMWVESSPDGRLLWTSAGSDLLAYRSADVTRANAAPLAAPIRPVRRLRGAVPSSGVTGAAFEGGRLLVAGSDAGPFQVWSIDLRSGRRRLEIERRVAGESEGLDAGAYLGGVLHWQILPFGAARPTWPGSGALLSFVRRGTPIELRGPRRAAAGRRTLAFRARYVAGGRRWPLAGALVTLAGRRVRADAQGQARVTATLRRGTYVARASRRGFARGAATVRVR